MQILSLQEVMARRQYTFAMLDAAAEKAQKMEEERFNEMVNTMLDKHKSSLDNREVKICCRRIELENYEDMPKGKLKQKTQIPFAWSFSGYGYTAESKCTLTCGNAVDHGIPFYKPWLTGVQKRMLSREASHQGDCFSFPFNPRRLKTIA